MPQPLPHAVQISFFNDFEGRSPAQLLDAWPTLVDVAEAASQSGVRVSVVQASTHSAQLTRNGVHYHFLPFGEAPLPLGNRPGFERNSAGVRGLQELLRALAADIFHVHGLGFPRHVLSLAALAPGVPIILQDHASGPPRFWRRPLWRRGMRLAAGISFCAPEQSRPFAEAGLLNPATRLYAIPEATSRFAPGDQARARQSTQLSGEPAVLWVGHLDGNKDPLTVLDGVSEAVRSLPDLQLWCCFGTAPLLREVQERISADRALRGRVHLIGRVPHERVEHLLRAADLFVLGSHRESTGFALIEAMACGLPPVVTDIPSFRALTGEGAVGRVWPCGDSRGLSEALRSAAASTDGATRSAVRAHFDRELSFAALGAKLAALYRETLACRRGQRGVGALLGEGTAIGMS